jgi:hypothetical protein
VTVLRLAGFFGQCKTNGKLTAKLTLGVTLVGGGGEVDNLRNGYANIVKLETCGPPWGMLEW